MPENAIPQAAAGSDDAAAAHAANSTIAASDAIARIVEARRDMPGALLPILHDIQDSQGFIPASAVPVIAKALNLSRAEVHGVITFYHHFREQPAGRHVVQVCRAEACQSVGADGLAAHACQSLGCDFHETTADGQFTLEPVYCLGQCATGPAMMIGERVHGRVDARRFDRLIDAVREDEEVRA
ncbi:MULTISPECIES: formate dehydrogenase subunit gamma [unclassified Cupriavidus]|uniref:formate dehydrogenase subunit gamma n=1 Tax=unclassified Cupriavidus TaxID=2640874 RepID=UPI0010F5C40A|nr:MULTISPECIES: formate dehydrogenase subunit gamma [unclassified Cupriavidus]MWL86386.1 formate dehydrogenase subunit gamma [Cupriavidus sp. SW-Y-13]